MEFTDREYAVVTEVWGDATPRGLGELDHDQLVAMHDRISRAVQTAFADDDDASLAVLLPIERKLVTTLHERL